MAGWTRSEERPPYDVLPVHGAIAPTIDQLFNERLQHGISGHILPLMEEIRALRAEVAELRGERRWGARMYRAEAAEYLGISPSWFDELVQRGHIAFVELPGLAHRSYLKITLDEYLSTSTPATPLAGTETAART